MKKRHSILNWKGVLFAILWTASLGMFAQNITVNGTITDSSGEPIIGATVVVKGDASHGNVTDYDGNYTLANVSPNATLVMSYVGMKTQEVAVNGRTKIDIVMSEDSELLDEVVVVGYGTQKRVNVTGAVSSVDSKVLEARPVQNVSQALQGVIPGLNFSVGNAGGALDSSLGINIRGQGTIGDGSGSSPLILIDGIEGNLNTVNPNDIESVSVLKDAASASIYGARASFGVILVTTKKGSSGKARVSYGGNMRFSDALTIPEMMDSYQFAQYWNRAATNAGVQGPFSDDALKNIKAYQEGTLKTATQVDPATNKWMAYTGANGNTDWFKEFYNDWVPSQDHNISINGGSEKIQYLVSASLLDQNGLMRHGKDKFKRYTTNGRITAQVADWFQLSYNTKFTREDFERPTYLTGLFFHNIARRWPTNPAYDPNGYPMEGMEIASLEDGGRQKSQKDFYTQQVNMVFEPITNWRINVDGSLRTTTQYQQWAVLPVYAHDGNGDAFPIVWDPGIGSWAAGSSGVNEYTWKENYYTTNIFTDYTKELDNGHNFKIMGGFNAELYSTRNLSGSKNTLISPTVPTLNTATVDPKTSGGYAENSVAGFFARFNYNFKDRYMFEANVRHDGSSRFVGDKRWGTFPSFSAGWNLMREAFLADFADKYNMGTFKLRASWGQLGNTNTNDAWYPFYQTMPTGSNYNWILNGTLPNYANLPGIVSSLKTWERIETWNLGLDWGLFSNRLTGSFDYFNRFTYDMIGPAPELSNLLGAGVPKINNSDMKAYGFELELSWRDKIKDFSYGAKLVLSDVREKILRYPNESMSIDTYYKGRFLGDIWGYTTVGIAQTQAEMDAHLAKVDQSSLGSNWGAGDIMYADINGDGKINTGSGKLGNTGDLKIIGNNRPRYSFGVTLDGAWKGLDLRVFLQGVGKRDYWLSGPYFWGANGMNMWQAAAFKEHWNFWRPEGDPLGANTNAYYPRVARNGGRNNYTQTRYLQNASYMRLKNIQLGYTLPQRFTQKAGMSSVRIYVSGDNLITLSDISGIFDAETLGTQWSDPGKIYPLQKVIAVGLNINF